MIKRKKKSENPQPKENLAPIPQQSTMVGFNKNRQDAALKQEPSLQHSLSLESRKNKSIKLDMLHAQHPMNFISDLKKRMAHYFVGTKTMPSMTNYSNMDAPTPMRPKDRPV